MRRVSVRVADDDPDRFLLELVDSAGDLQGTVTVYVRKGIAVMIVEGEHRRRTHETDLGSLNASARVTA